MDTIEPGDMIIISSEAIPNTEQKFWRTMILIVIYPTT